MGSNPSFTSPLFRLVGILFFLHYLYCEHLLLYDYGPTIGLYQGLWICSLSLLLAGLGLILGYPKLVSTSLVAVATGHFLWTIDSIYMLYNWDIGKTIFDIGDYGGVGRQVTFATVWTNLHHIWFMPICVYYLRSIGRRLTPSDLHCSVLWICFISAATACVVPMECVEYDHPVHGRRCMSLNVNMIRKFWGLEGSKFMHSLDRSDGTHPVIFFIFANFMHDYVFNGFWFLVLMGFVNVGAAGGGEIKDSVRLRNTKSKMS
ncbi:hypothetical protein TrCOL_g10370 [Triparma columacea]|uniref:Uncharacterized protein n=1 Tax=Triparma columacea TaxID=722753 RepID=A0A9W7FWV3_9STRA|nr:hypothetical protein TrCOL_g10370 [Triparma columacea]